jgi:hypothetical protein
VITYRVPSGLPSASPHPSSLLLSTYYHAHIRPCHLIVHASSSRLILPFYTYLLRSLYRCSPRQRPPASRTDAIYPSLTLCYTSTIYHLRHPLQLIIRSSSPFYPATIRIDSNFLYTGVFLLPLSTHLQLQPPHSLNAPIGHDLNSDEELPS